MGIRDRERVKDTLKVRFRAGSETGWRHEQEGQREDKFFPARIGGDSLSTLSAPAALGMGQPCLLAPRNCSPPASQPGLDKADWWLQRLQQVASGITLTALHSGSESAQIWPPQSASFFLLNLKLCSEPPPGLSGA